MKLRFELSLFLILAFVLAGCVPEQGVQPAPPTISPVADPITNGYSSTPTDPPVATGTWIALPAETPEPLPTITLTPFSTDTPTPLPTLEPVRAKEAFKDLLWNNAGCSAPCFMGIVPGQTTLDDLSALVAHLGSELDHTNTQNDKEFYEITYRFDSGLALDLVAIVQSGTVKNLNAIITPPQNQSSTARREWSTYSPERLMNQYGLPSKVSLFAGRGAILSYTMDMYFDTRDFVIEYHSYDLSSKLKICPLADRFDNIRVWMGKNPVFPPLPIVPLEKATSMTMEEFSQLLSGPSNQACFHLKEEMVP